MSEDTNDDSWVEGHRAGYVKGRDDGIGIGYADAKLRTYAVLDTLEASGGIAKPAVVAVRDALSATLGRR